MHRQLTSRITLAGALAVAVALGACARPARQQQPAPGRPTNAAAAAVSTDSLAALLHTRFGLAPISLEVASGHRVTVGFGSAPWLDSSDAVRFDRAYDIARLVWDEYGAAVGLDTVIVRTALEPMATFGVRLGGTSAPSAGAPSRVEQFFFYPEQLTARERPRFGVAR